MLSNAIKRCDVKTSDRCAVRVEKLRKVYPNGTIAVKGISFCVKRGEIFGFLGPNGAGKTTTVRMLVGLTTITSGRAKICGYDITRHGKRVKKLIGVVPDISNLYSELTCYQNLLFSAKMYGIKGKTARRNVEEILRFFGLEKYRNTRFKALSKGLKRRLTIAAALVHNPRIVFLDEPTSGLDVVSRRLLWNKLVELNSKGITIFLTTHNIYEAFSLSHRVAVINKGKIVAIGTPEELSRKFSVREVLEVGFYPRNPAPQELLDSLRGVLDAKMNSGRLELIIDDEIEALESLASYAKRRGLRISLLRLREADAEEVFLRIIGEEK